jgi:hypothetical protein
MFSMHEAFHVIQTCWVQGPGIYSVFDGHHGHHDTNKLQYIVVGESLFVMHILIQYRLSNHIWMHCFPQNLAPQFERGACANPLYDGGVSQT